MRKLVQIFGRNPVLALVDVALINAGFIFAFLLRFGADTRAHRVNLAEYVDVLPLISVLTVLLFYVGSLYGRWQDRSRTDLVSAISTAVGGILISTMVLAFWKRQFALPRTVLLLAVPLQLVLVSGVRLLLQWLHHRYPDPRRILLVSDNSEDTARLLEKFAAYGQDRYIVHGPVGSRDLDVLDGELEEVHEVVLAQGAANRAGVIGHCAMHNRHVLLVPSPTDFLVLGATPQSVDDALLLSIRPPRLRPAHEFAKRIQDLLLSSILLVLAAPVMLILYVLIPMDSKGSPIFRQARLGKGGQPFTLMKFRTMVANAEEASGPVLASEGDPRITRLGNFLRATRLDELPQLINVLRGEMSIVGPRPEREFFVRQFEEEMPAYALRMAVKPGITGLAQVQGRYSSTAERKLRFDLLYICNYSLVLDLKILLQTISVVMRPEQAAGVRTTPLSVITHDERAVEVSMTPQSLVMPERATAQALAVHAHLHAVFGEVATKSETLGA
ncbi:MAG TPA: sugar transferase [Terriglobales bacterium]|nr:sugar transferase [Terriglobales bacterium]